ncbi:MAG: hypothetical protein M9962_05600 [Oligoflexia bacterium]|nr:hypothetical protein [Oligoflexia bacterium]
MKKFILLSFVLLHPLSFASEKIEKKATDATPKKQKEEWFQCEQDDDCVNISFSCAGGTVNKKFEAEARELYRGQSAIRDCAITEPKKNELPFRVFCKDKKCGSQGRNPKIDFS